MTDEQTEKHKERETVSQRDRYTGRWQDRQKDRDTTHATRDRCKFAHTHRKKVRHTWRDRGKRSSEIPGKIIHTQSRERKRDTEKQREDCLVTTMAEKPKGRECTCTRDRHTSGETETPNNGQ